ncbi:amino acid kinase family protein, partial [Candidatus Binatus sp.]|uniref:amino acid kinase family protein n=1 Tax=Candidatus Binatus sp. TaxID=2811406 RepID=UPI003F96CD17
MGLVVQKYGGTSVGSIERIKAVADRVVRARDGGNRIVVVVSAMAGETNRLFKLASELSESPNARETDVLVATGEQVSAALLAIRLQSMGHPTVSFLAFQMNLTTDSNHGRARIKSVQCDRVMRALDDGQIVVVAGYQGVNPAGDITTLGRGASDLTAVALAWDHVDIAGPWLNLMRNSLNAQIWSYKNPDFLCVSGTHGSAHLALYDQSMWDKYQLAGMAGDKFKTNTLIEQPKLTSNDPANFEDPEGVFSATDNAIPTLMRRGVVFLAC